MLTTASAMYSGTCVGSARARAAPAAPRCAELRASGSYAADPGGGCTPISVRDGACCVAPSSAPGFVPSGGTEVGILTRGYRSTIAGGRTMPGVVRGAGTSAAVSRLRCSRRGVDRVGGTSSSSSPSSASSRSGIAGGSGVGSISGMLGARTMRALSPACAGIDVDGARIDRDPTAAAPSSARADRGRDVGEVVLFVGAGVTAAREGSSFAPRRAPSAVSVDVLESMLALAPGALARRRAAAGASARRRDAARARCAGSRRPGPRPASSTTSRRTGTGGAPARRILGDHLDIRVVVLGAHRRRCGRRLVARRLHLAQRLDPRVLVGEVGRCRSYAAIAAGAA